MLRRKNKAPKRTQSTFCWCPGCQNELVADPATTIETLSYGVYRYSCGSCGAGIVFDFCIAPCPVLLRTELPVGGNYPALGPSKPGVIDPPADPLLVERY